MFFLGFVASQLQLWGVEYDLSQFYQDPPAQTSKITNEMPASNIEPIPLEARTSSNPTRSVAWAETTPSSELPQEDITFLENEAVSTISFADEKIQEQMEQIAALSEALSQAQQDQINVKNLLKKTQDQPQIIPTIEQGIGASAEEIQAATPPTDEDEGLTGTEIGLIIGGSVGGFAALTMIMRYFYKKKKEARVMSSQMKIITNIMEKSGLKPNSERLRVAMGEVALKIKNGTASDEEIKRDIQDNFDTHIDDARNHLQDKIKETQDLFIEKRELERKLKIYQSGDNKAFAEIYKEDLDEFDEETIKSNLKEIDDEIKETLPPKKTLLQAEREFIETEKTLAELNDTAENINRNLNQAFEKRIKKQDQARLDDIAEEEYQKAPTFSKKTTGFFKRIPGNIRRRFRNDDSTNPALKLTRLQPLQDRIVNPYDEDLERRPSTALTPPLSTRSQSTYSTTSEEDPEPSSPRRKSTATPTSPRRKSQYKGR